MISSNPCRRLAMAAPARPQRVRTASTTRSLRPGNQPSETVQHEGEVPGSIRLIRAVCRSARSSATITGVTMIVISESDGNAIGVFNDAPIPRAGDEISVEGTMFSVQSVLIEYSNDSTGSGTFASVTVEKRD
jgi:hypothetical protein